MVAKRTLFFEEEEKGDPDPDSLFVKKVPPREISDDKNDGAVFGQYAKFAD